MWGKGGHYNKGCHGGDFKYAFSYFKDYSPTLESVYPFTSGTGDDSTGCLYSTSKATNIKVKDYGMVNQEIDNMKAALQQQPFVTGITANNKYIHSYLSGVIDAKDCYDVGDAMDHINPINHAVTVVGYGHDEAIGLGYWLIKNSWNTTWGDKGFVKIEMSMNDSFGICGIKLYAKYPILD